MLEWTGVGPYNPVMFLKSSQGKWIHILPSFFKTFKKSKDIIAKQILMSLVCYLGSSFVAWTLSGVWFSAQKLNSNSGARIYVAVETLYTLSKPWKSMVIANQRASLLIH